MATDAFTSRVRAVITDPTLSYAQRRSHLAAIAESSLPYPPLSDAASEALNKGIIDDLFEGNAPYRPRYILPDYALALENGSEYLQLEPPTDFDDALMFLLITYTQVPSITGYPVYLGDLDTLLEPFADGVDDDHLVRCRSRADTDRSEPHPQGRAGHPRWPAPRRHPHRVPHRQAALRQSSDDGRRPR